MSARNLPYGYKMEKGIILIDETEAVYVRMIFESRSNGMGVYAIGKMLYEQQIRTDLLGREHRPYQPRTRIPLLHHDPV